MRVWRMRFVMFSLVGLFMWGCAPTLTQKERVEKYGPNPPVIDAYGAAAEAAAGRSWRVYVAAHDPDGDMDRVLFELDRPGYAIRDYHKRLGNDLGQSFSGYFYLTIPNVSAWRGQALLGNALTMECEIIDKAGHKSKLITLPFQVVLSPVPHQTPEGFAEVEANNLGPIMIRFEMEQPWGNPFDDHDQ